MGQDFFFHFTVLLSWLLFFYHIILFYQYYLLLLHLFVSLPINCFSLIPVPFVQRNYRFFFMFVSSTTLLCLYVFAFCWVNIKKIMDAYHCNLWRAVMRSPVSGILILYTFLGAWFVGGLTTFHLYLIYTNQVLPNYLAILTPLTSRTHTHTNVCHLCKIRAIISGAPLLYTFGHSPTSLVIWARGNGLYSMNSLDLNTSWILAHSARVVNS